MTTEFYTKTAALIILGLGFFLVGCEQTPGILAEYEGVNLIDNKGFDDPDWTPDQNTTYMVFEPVSATTAAAVGLPTGVTSAAVYRLEIVNLVPDGDFEETSVGAQPAGWGVTGVAVGEVTLAQTVVAGNSLRFEIIDPNNVVRFDLGTLSDSYPIGKNYILRFEFQADSDFTYNFFVPAIGSQNLRTAEVEDASIVQHFPADFPITTTEFTSTVGTDAFFVTDRVQSGYIDDFRITRTDIPIRIRINLSWSDVDRGTNLPLVSGWYKFSVYVRSDPDAALNRFHSQDITIGTEINILEFPNVDTTTDLSGWQQVSMITFKQIDTPVDPAELVLELSVSPTDLRLSNSRDVGSLLIAAPSLELFGDEASALASIGG